MTFLSREVSLSHLDSLHMPLFIKLKTSSGTQRIDRHIRILHLTQKLHHHCINALTRIAYNNPSPCCMIFCNDSYTSSVNATKLREPERKTCFSDCLGMDDNSCIFTDNYFPIIIMVLAFHGETFLVLLALTHELIYYFLADIC